MDRKIPFQEMSTETMMHLIPDDIREEALRRRMDISFEVIETVQIMPLPKSSIGYPGVVYDRFHKPTNFRLVDRR